MQTSTVPPHRFAFRMLPLLGLVAASCSTAPPARTDSASPLFNGVTLDGWVQRGGKALYRVEDSCIVGETRPNQPNSFLCTPSDFCDFTLELEFMVDDGLNSGVQVRSQFRPENGPRGAIDRVFGYQVEIDPSERAWTGGIYDEGRRGWLASLADKPQARAAFKHGEWNTMRVACEGRRLRTWINGVPCADLDDEMTPCGFIALQVHDVGARADPLTVRWRKIMIHKVPGQAQRP